MIDSWPKLKCSSWDPQLFLALELGPQGHCRDTKWTSPLPMWYYFLQLLCLYLTSSFLCFGILRPLGQGSKFSSTLLGPPMDVSVPAATSQAACQSTAIAYMPCQHPLLPVNQAAACSLQVSSSFHHLRNRHCLCHCHHHHCYCGSVTSAHS